MAHWIVIQVLLVSIISVHEVASSVSPYCKLDLALLVDSSGSICEKSTTIPGVGCDNWKLVKSFLADVVDKLPKAVAHLWVDAKIGLVSFSRSSDVIFNFNSYTNTDDIRKAILQLEYKGSYTNTPAAFRQTREEIFNPTNGDRFERDAADVAIIVTDGIPCIKGKCPQDRDEAFRQKAIDESRRLKESGVTVLAVGITNQIDDDLLRQISSANYKWRSPTFQTLSSISGQLVDILDKTCRSVAMRPPPTRPPPTRPPPRSCRNEVDVVFVMDSSGSITPQKFNQMKQFVAELIGQIDIASGRTRVGIVRFSDDVNYSIHLNNRERSIVDAVTSLSYTRGKTNTGAALRFMADEMFTRRNGDRQDVANLAIVLTDGGSQDKARTIDEAIRARTTKDIHIIAVGIGKSIDQYEVQAIASHPYKDNFIHLNNDDWQSSINKFKDLICKNVDYCNSGCRNGGTCFNGFTGRRCKCPNGFSGNSCEYRCIKLVNVALALDSAGFIGQEDYQKVIDFAIELYDSLPFDNGARGAMGTFSNITKTLFTLNNFPNSKKNILDAMNFPFYQYSVESIDIGIEMMKDLLLYRGGNAGVHNVGIIITDGYSDNLERVFDLAKSARRQGNTLIAIGVDRELVTREQLNVIASYPAEKNLFLKHVSELPSVQDTIREYLCQNEDPCASHRCANGGRCVPTLNSYYCDCPTMYSGKYCERSCAGKADVLFLIDVSGSIRHEHFDKVKQFFNRIVGELEVWDGTVRIAAMTFSDNYSVHFTLGTYTDVQDYQVAINLLEHTGGKTDIGGALNGALREIFAQRSGDRPDVPNYLVLFSDGKPTINEAGVLPAAINVRSSGIHIMAVGVGTTVDKFKLYAIASHPKPENVFTMNHYSSLLDFVDDIYKGMCNDVNECASNPCGSGTCVNLIGEYRCICPRGGIGPECDGVCNRKIDVTFVLDVSGSVDDVYKMSVEFMRQVVSSLNLDDSGSYYSRVALITYSTEVSVAFDHNNSYRDHNGILNAISFLKSGGQTNTQAALKLVLEKVIPKTRPGVYTPVIVITDGESNVHAYNTIPMAEKLRNRGHDIYAVALGENVNMDEINGLATRPVSPWVTHLRNARYVRETAQDLLRSLCRSQDLPDDDPCASHRCENGGRCVRTQNSYNCDCPRMYSGKYCERNDDPCASHRCRNGGRCVRRQNSYYCDCPIMYSGRYCERFEFRRRY